MQIIQQGEVDALGLEIEEKKIKSVYIIDIAFHENGLNYGSKKVTVAKIIKKMVRSAITIMNYFEINDADIIFASPKISNPTNELLNECIIKLNAYFSSKKLNFNCRIIGNEDFKNKILDVVVELADSVADTSELFMRSLQMYKLFHPINSKNDINSKIKDIKKIKIDKYNEIKIGALVQSSFPKIINKLEKEELKNLQNKEYCKKLFNLDYPLLLLKDNNEERKEQIYFGGYQRYYVNSYKIQKEEYYLTKEWYERHKVKFIEWIKLKTI